MNEYNKLFFNYIQRGSIESAKHIIPILMENIKVKSVLDIGCGQGTWLSIWQELGVKDVIGIDGKYVDKTNLLIPENLFYARCLNEGFALNRKFDLVQSLEVAEHLPGKNARNFVKNIVAHGNIILFSAAPKGQGGHHHINEQDYNYWKDIFYEYGYIAVDFLRPIIRCNSKICPWYRYNTILYVAENELINLPDSLKENIVNNKIKDISPVLYKIRKLLIRILPVSIATIIAKIKEFILANYYNE